MNIKSWIVKKALVWLGLEENQIQIDTLFDLYKDLVSIGIDVHFNEPHMILIFSKLKGGQIRHIEADFKDLRDLRDFTQELKRRFNTEKVLFDAPYHKI